MLDQYIIPFNENDVLTKEIDFDFENEFNKVNKLQNIIEAISNLKRQKDIQINLISSFSGTFPKLRNDYVKEIDKINQNINKLINNYNQIINS